jgi:hypothetical protein
VHERNRDELDTAERKPPLDGKQPQVRNAAAYFRRRVEDIREHPLEIAQGFAIAVATYRRSLENVVPAHLVEPENMIGMTVREQDRVDATDVVCERLSPKIGGSVDEHVADGGGNWRPRTRPFAFLQVDQNRRTRAMVPRVGRMADRTIASYSRNAVRRAGPEKRYAHVRGLPRDSQGSMMILPVPVASMNRIRSS